MNLLGHSVGRLGRARVEAGWAAVNSAQKPILNKKFFFFFKSVL
jgi:hypothetical protein